MAFDEKLAERVRGLLDAGITEKKLFGGLAFLLHGNMSVGVHGNELIVRVAPESTDRLLAEHGARLFDITGRPMQGWLLVSGAGIQSGAALKKWVTRGVAYAATLPRK